MQIRGNAVEAISTGREGVVAITDWFRENWEELPVGLAVAAELTLPVAVGAELVDEHRALLAAVAGGVPLPVAVDVEPAHAPRPLHLRLEDAGEDRPATPGHVPGETDVDRAQAGGRHGRRRRVSRTPGDSATARRRVPWTRDPTRVHTGARHAAVPERWAQPEPGGTR